MNTAAIFALLAGFFAGFLIGAALVSQSRQRASARAAAAEARATELASRAASVEQQLAAQTLALADAQADALQATAAAAAAAEAQARAEGTFAQLSQQALQRNTEQFLQLAEQRLREAQGIASADLDRRSQSLEALLDPLATTLASYQEALQGIEVKREGAYQQLLERVASLDLHQGQLQRDTQALVAALRSPNTRGRWGEVQLRRVVELAGMVERCDFIEQGSVDGEDGRLRPDLVVLLPGGGTIVVDAKVPLSAYLDATQATTEQERKAHLERHARQVREHLTQLSRKEYWRQFDQAPEFVVAFLPGEPIANAAFEQDPTLLEFALANQVLPATPTNLVTLLRTVAYNWRHDDLEANAVRIAKLGTDLYDRLKVVGTHLSRVQRSLQGTVEGFNALVGSVEGRLLVTARELSQAQLAGSATDTVPSPGPVEVAVRSVSAPELVED